MEARRRRRTAARRGAAYGGRTSSAYMRRRETGGGGVFNMLLLIILAGALVYVLVATPVGTFLKSKLFPNSGETGAPLPTAVTTGLPLPTDASETPQSGVLTEQMEFPGLEMFALEIGVYTTEADAQGLMKTLRSLGAAGYGLTTADGIRVMASCYTTEAAAKSVADRLTEQGYRCSVYPIRANAVAIGVTAHAEQIEAVRSAVSLSKAVIDDMNEEVLRFDTEERSIEYGKAIVNEMIENIRAVRDSLSGVADAGGAAKAIDEYYMQLTALASVPAASGTDNRVEFSGMLKGLQLGMIERYCALLEALRKLGQ